MKKKISVYFLCLGILSFVLLLLVTNKTIVYAEEAEDISIEAYLDNISALTELSGEEFIQKSENRDTYVIYVGRPTCYYCREYSANIKRVNELLQNQLYYYDIDREDFSQEIYDIIVSRWGVTGTPAFVNIVNGEVVSGYIGIDITSEELAAILSVKGTNTETEESTTKETSTESTIESSISSSTDVSTQVTNSEVVNESSISENSSTIVNESTTTTNTIESDNISIESDVKHESIANQSKDVVTSNSSTKLPSTNEESSGEIKMVGFLLLICIFIRQRIMNRKKTN